MEEGRKFENAKGEVKSELEKEKGKLCDIEIEEWMRKEI